jgi:hypothetical protein
MRVQVKREGNRVTVKWPDEQIERFKETEEGRAYLEYYSKTSGDRIGLTVPYGYPGGIKDSKDIIAVYKECVKRGVTWEELLGFERPPVDADI